MSPSNKKNSVLLGRENYRMMEWKNGRGKTAEIAISPSTASFPDGPFEWRLSSAQIAEAGPFSLFPGYDRYLFILKGKGVQLQREESGKKTILKTGEGVQFSGKEQIYCELLDQEVTDLNLIFKSDQVTPQFNSVQVLKKSRSFQLEGKVSFLFGMTGTPLVSIYPGEETCKLKPGDTLRIDGPVMVLIDPRELDSSVILIEILDPKPA